MNDKLKLIRRIKTFYYLNLLHLHVLTEVLFELPSTTKTLVAFDNML